MSVRHWAVIPAAGSGVRMGSSIPKQYLSLAGRTVIERVVDVLLAEPAIAGVTVAVAADDPYGKRYLPGSWPKPVRIAAGGETRAHTVLNALLTLDEELQSQDWVLVHDAARPCLHPRDLAKLLQAVGDDPVGGILATPVADTLKKVDEDRLITASQDRADLWRAFTPQMFRYGLLKQALQAALAAGEPPSDEAGALERLGQAVKVVEGRTDNIKITRPDDVALAEAILAHHAGERP